MKVTIECGCSANCRCAPGNKRAVDDPVEDHFNHMLYWYLVYLGPERTELMTLEEIAQAATYDPVSRVVRVSATEEVVRPFRTGYHQTGRVYSTYQVRNRMRVLGLQPLRRDGTPPALSRFPVPNPPPPSPTPPTRAAQDDILQRLFDELQRLRPPA